MMGEILPNHIKVYLNHWYIFLLSVNWYILEKYHWPTWIFLDISSYVEDNVESYMYGDRLDQKDNYIS